MSEHRSKYRPQPGSMAYEMEELLKLKRMQDFICASAPASERDFQHEWCEIVAQNKIDIAKLEAAQRTGKRLALDELVAIYQRMP